MLSAGVLLAATIFSPEAQLALSDVDLLQYDAAREVLERGYEADPSDVSVHWLLATSSVSDPERTVARAADEFLSGFLQYGDPAQIELIQMRYEWSEFVEDVRERAPTPADARFGEQMAWRAWRYADSRPDDPWGWLLLSSILQSNTHTISEQGAIEATARAIDAAPYEPALREHYIRLKKTGSPLRLESRLMLTHATFTDWYAPERFSLLAELARSRISVKRVQGIPEHPAVDDFRRLIAALVQLHLGGAQLREGERTLRELALREPGELTQASRAAAELLCKHYLRENDPEAILEVTSHMLAFYPETTSQMLGYQGQARLAEEDYDGAFFDLRRAVNLGASDPVLYLPLGDSLRELERAGDASVVYDFYRERLLECAARSYPFCPTPSFRDQMQARIMSRAQVIRMFPEIIAPATIRFLLELLATAAALLLSVARPRRSRKYIGIGLLAAEVMFFVGLLLIRMETETAAQAASAAQITWLASLSVRGFLLATAGSYLSAAAGTRPKASRLVSRRNYLLLVVALLASAFIGFGWGNAVPGPEPENAQRARAHQLAFHSLDPSIRTTELGVTGEDPIDRIAFGIRILIDELTGRLVLPALFAYGLSLLPLFRKRRPRRIAAGAAAALTAASIIAPWGPLPWIARTAGLSALVTARMYWGLWACVLIHLVFVAGQILGGAS